MLWKYVFQYLNTENYYLHTYTKHFLKFWKEKNWKSENINKKKKRKKEKKMVKAVVRLRRRQKKKKKKKPSPQRRERERERELCEKECFYNCAGDLVVWHSNKVYDFSFFLLLYTSKR